MVALCRQPSTYCVRPLFTRQSFVGHINHPAWIISGPARMDRCSRPKRWMRGVKTKATMQIPDLPQGAIMSNLSIETREEGIPTYPTVVQQAKNNMLKFDHCVLLTRVGGFYEVWCPAIEVLHYAHYIYSSTSNMQNGTDHCSTWRWRRRRPQQGLCPWYTSQACTFVNVRS